MKFNRCLPVSPLPLPLPPVVLSIVDEFGSIRISFFFFFFFLFFPRVTLFATFFFLFFLSRFLVATSSNDIKPARPSPLLSLRYSATILGAHEAFEHAYLNSWQCEQSRVFEFFRTAVVAERARWMQRNDFYCISQRGIPAGNCVQ